MMVFNAIQKHYRTDEIDFTSAKIVQNFLFKFIDSQMKTDKMVMMVGKAYEDFIFGLEKPLNLNEMRIMKEANYVRLAIIFSDSAFLVKTALNSFRPSPLG